MTLPYLLSFVRVNIFADTTALSACKDRYLVFEFEDNYLAILDREASSVASSCILKDYGIPSERSADLSEPYIDIIEENQEIEPQNFGDSPVTSSEFGFDGLLWA